MVSDLRLEATVIVFMIPSRLDQGKTMYPSRVGQHSAVNMFGRSHFLVIHSIQRHTIYIIYSWQPIPSALSDSSWYVLK